MIHSERSWEPYRIFARWRRRAFTSCGKSWRFARPVLLYSIGKDSSTLLRLAQKAFLPARVPFPLLHVDTTVKFREMIEFRARTAREMGLDLIVYTHPPWARKSAATC